MPFETEKVKDCGLHWKSFNGFCNVLPILKTWTLSTFGSTLLLPTHVTSKWNGKWHLCMWKCDTDKSENSDMLHLVRNSYTVFAAQRSRLAQLSFSRKHCLHFAELYLTWPSCCLKLWLTLLPPSKILEWSTTERWNIFEFWFNHNFLSSGMSTV